MHQKSILKILMLSLNAYQGPLDVLLDLAKAQKVDLENISITLLADQFHELYYQMKKILI